MTVSSSQILTADTVPGYLAQHKDKLEGVIPKDATLTAKAIQGGNVNYAFCVTATSCSGSTTGDDVTIQTIFVKQAPEFVAIFGPDGFPLTSERMQLELDVYREWQTLLGPVVSQTYLPTIYFFDGAFW